MLCRVHTQMALTTSSGQHSIRATLSESLASTASNRCASRFASDSSIYFALSTQFAGRDDTGTVLCSVDGDNWDATNGRWAEK